MPYLAPGSQIVLYPMVPLTKDYENTLYFANFDAQKSYFDGLPVKYPFLNQSYQRWDSGKLRLDVASNTNADAMYTCNYLRFQNTPFGTKWYSAFIDRINYVNNETIEVEYTIDVVQTWLWGLSIEQCFIEREIPETDNFGEHLIDEGLDTGSTYWTPYNNFIPCNANRVGILATCDTEGNPIEGGMVANNVFTGLNFMQVDISDPAGPGVLNQLIAKLVDSGDEDSIVSMYQYPSFVGGADRFSSSFTVSFAMPGTLGGATANTGYKPKNAKLLQYPYSYIEVSNNCGTVKRYKWESFGQDTGGGQGAVMFRIVAVSVPSPEMLCYPQWYENIADNYDEGVPYTNFPQCAWTGDAFDAWFAQNAQQSAMSIVNTAVSYGVTGAGVGMGVGGAAGGIGAVPGTLVGAGVGTVVGAVVGGVQQAMKGKDMSNAPAPAHGQVGTGVLNAAEQKVGYNFRYKTVTKEYAESIDMYFSMFGYKVNRVGVPNISSRPHWNYVKTIGCDFQGGCPSDAKVKLCQIFDNGIRFWKNASEIGAYNIDNSPA